MKLLALDTSTDLASVALSDGAHIESLEQPSVRQHAQQLLPMIQQLLSQSGLTLSQLDGIVFDKGPGSFTGLRIACSMAKAFAYAHDLPIYGVSALDAIAYQMQLKRASVPSMGIVAMLDARMQEVYWAYYPPDSIHAAQDACVTSASALEVPKGCAIVLAGVGLEAYNQHWSVAFKNAIQQQHVIAPSAKALIQLVKLGAIPKMAAAEALPMYVRNTVTQAGGPHG